MELKKDLEELARDLQTADPIAPGLTIAAVIAQRIPTAGMSFEHSIAIEARECLGYLQTLYFQLLARLCSPAPEVEKNQDAANRLLA